MLYWSSLIFFVGGGGSKSQSNIYSIDIQVYIPKSLYDVEQIFVQENDRFLITL